MIFTFRTLNFARFVLYITVTSPFFTIQLDFNTVQNNFSNFNDKLGKIQNPTRTLLRESDSVTELFKK
ncbi:hypothetical protein BpHYR1_022441 [Brachionus plicatilis]|uniref:Uncharacterized protein n=1 Tax=Brachionus plicatilis TaxID=10195 RepID=A0A3M7SMS7_BRAPC|nr:hypothetical protein BpHYR1_022441 [Brachionus plicatilis]